MFSFGVGWGALGAWVVWSVFPRSVWYVFVCSHRFILEWCTPPPRGGVASCSAQPNRGGGLGARSSYSILDALKVTSCAAYYPKLVGVLHIVININVNVGSAASQGISRANCCGYAPRDM